MKLRNYDIWKLDNAYDDSSEVFESELPTYYSNNESLLEQFENDVKELAKSYGLSESEEV